MGYRFCYQRLSRTRRTVQEDAFWRFDTDTPEYLRLRERVFDGFPHFLDLVCKTPDLVVTDRR